MLHAGIFRNEKSRFLHFWGQILAHSVLADFPLKCTRTEYTQHPACLVSQILGSIDHGDRFLFVKNTQEKIIIYPV